MSKEDEDDEATAQTGMGEFDDAHEMTVSDR